MRLPLLLVACSIVLAGGTAGGAGAQARPRVTVITDSVGGVLYWEHTSRAELARGLDLRLEARTCRKLVAPGCYAYGRSPPSALAEIRRLGPALGRVVVIDVGYNDVPDGYAQGLDEVMQALRAAGVARVVWVTLEENEDPWVAINTEIRAATSRWPELVVADWAPVAVGKPWFVDAAHMNTTGGRAFARFLRPYVLYACGGPCRPKRR